ncbi:TlpA disulfide reductase family protein [Allopontixanthobacter sp.]|uniref:TlpA family protein disulfide reductase n=1 Tax=Allopontixanthobacter sp. TaxID=2906452 RepID=UPI002AB8B0C2|nr:TlpA disulfide reductase family protein [Allopontixanthobacter sp.]MDZ4307817.1 TlpA disulfide reductase family protein [Allopontixanthobacter sp.]
MSLRLSLTLLLALPLAACDREAAPDAQEQAGLEGAKPDLVGTIDTSHAGELMPAILLDDPAGRQINTGALQGGPVLLNLWATWCAPCVVEMPMLDDLAGEYAGALRVMTVSQDMGGAEKVEKFFAANKFENLQPWLDPENALGFGIEGGVLPTTVLYDSAGREVWRITGEYDWSGAEAREAINDALGEDGA